MINVNVEHKFTLVFIAKLFLLFVGVLLFLQII